MKFHPLLHPLWPGKRGAPPSTKPCNTYYHFTGLSNSPAVLKYLGDAGLLGDITALVARARAQDEASMRRIETRASGKIFQMISRLYFSQSALRIVEIEIHFVVFNRLYLLLFFMKLVKILWLCSVIRTIALANWNKVYFKRYSVVSTEKWILIWQLVPVLSRHFR